MRRLALALRTAPCSVLMFGIGSGELVIIAIVMLLAVGPNRMPTLIKAVGKGIREFRKASNELRKQSGIDDLMRDDDLAGLRKLQHDVMKEPPPTLSTEDRLRERPTEGVDLVEARDRAKLEAERARLAAARAEEARAAEAARIAEAPEGSTAADDEHADDEPPAPVARQAVVDEEAKS